MRYLDVGVALMIGAAGVTVLGSLTPSTQDSAASRYHVTLALRDSVLRVVESEGIPWFVRAPPTAACSNLESFSNSTVTFTGEIGPESCGPPPPRGAISASLSCRLAGQEVLLVAWTERMG